MDEEIWRVRREIGQHKESIRNLKLRGIQYLERVVARDNLGKCLHCYLAELLDRWIYVNIEYDCDDNIKYIAVKVGSDDEFDLEAIRAIVQHVVPWFEYCDDVERNEDAARTRCGITPVSRASWLDQAPPSDEDRVMESESCNMYAAYCLVHKLDNIHAKLNIPLKSNHDWDSAWFIVKERNLNGLQHDYDSWASSYRSSFWYNQHEHVLDFAIALAPLRMTLYELVWIAAWIPDPPLDFLCYRLVDGASQAYDPNLRRKLRLFESVARSWDEAAAKHVSPTSTESDADPDIDAE